MRTKFIGCALAVLNRIVRFRRDTGISAGQLEQQVVIKTSVATWGTTDQRNEDNQIHTMNDSYDGNG